MEKFNDLYRKHYKSVFRLAFRYLNDFENASDISQDVFLHLFNCLTHKKEIRNEKAWLFKVTSNLCFAFHKKNNRINNYKTEVVNNTKAVETGSGINDSLNKLNDKDRILLILYNEEFSYKELAEITGIKFTSVGKTLARALKKLKDEVGKTNKMSGR